MSHSQAVLELVKKLMLAEIAAQGGEAPGELNSETRLYGKDGLLDSMALVSLVMSLEQEIAEKFGVEISLADDKALSQKNSPFRTIGSLVTYAVGEIEAARGQ
jgi:acyl carrier protein